MYPRGLPASPDPFLIQDVVDGAIGVLKELSRPSLVYLHLYPPHGEYRPRGKYNRAFQDGWRAAPKPTHSLVEDVKEVENQENQRWKYDQYLASWDAELSRLFEFLRASRLLEQSYVILTSDHGELFERGVIGHYTPLIYDPLIHVPLIVSAPGQTTRADVRTATSSVDVVPTLAALLGVDRPAWAEGKILPGLGGEMENERGVYSMDAKTNSSFSELTSLSFSLTKGAHRLTYYEYPKMHHSSYELYDLQEDPEELHDLYSPESPAAKRLKDELLQTLDQANRPFA
jgi:arylsulfatase A-like enzyme